MDIASLLVILCIYCVLFFFDAFFKTCAHYPYLQFLKGTGLEIKFLQLRWTTTFFNRLFLRWGSSHTKFFELWFLCGVHVTLILLPVSIFLVLFSILKMLLLKNNVEVTGVVFEPVIPGFNFPISELGYYCLALIISSIVHEVGHALACVKEDVHLINIGVSVFFVFPVAYVNISSETLNSLNPWRSLKILCAGIWHNLILAFLTLLVYVSLPYIFSSFFYLNRGIVVVDVHKGSPLYGIKGLQVGDKINQITDCVVHNDEEWINCLHGMLNRKPGYCISTDLVHDLDESVPLKHISKDQYDCCSLHRKESVCFEYMDNQDGILELPPHVCLPARPAVENSLYFCDSNKKSCPSDLHCFCPLLFNGSNLFKIKLIDKSDVIYIGHPMDFVHTLRISPFIPKYFFNTSVVPDVLSKFLLFLMSFSAGLAFLNVIPSVFMDGQYITNCVVKIFFGSFLKSPHLIRLISLLSCVCGTVILVLLIIYYFLKMYLYV